MADIAKIKLPDGNTYDIVDKKSGYITSSGTAKTISDILPISKGGTGQTTGVNATNALINSLPTGDNTPTDADYYISQYVNGGTTNTTYYRRPMSLLWNYIKSKLSTVAISGSYNDLSNKPTIPSVGNGTVTIKQAGTSKGTFTMNQSGNTTIELTDNNTTYGVATSSALGLVKSGTDITVDSSGNVSVNDDSHNHVISNVDGLQSALDGKAASSHTHSSYVNQNAFSNVVVGSTTVAADSATDTLTLVAGSNVTLTPDATNDKITIAATNTDTKNTAGSTDTSSKIFLVGATSQAANPQTYSDNQVYATNGQLNGNSVRIAEKVTLQYDSNTEAINFVFG